MKRRGRRILLWTVAGLMIALLVGSIVLLRSIELPQRYRNFIEARLREETGADIRIGRARMRLLGGLGIEFRDLVIQDPEEKSDFIRARSFILQMQILPLLRRQMRWKSLILEEPSIYLRWPRRDNSPAPAKGKAEMHQGEAGYGNIVRLLSIFSGGRIRVQRGSLHFIDESVPPGFTFARIENLSIKLGTISMDAPIPFDVKARQPISGGTDGRLSIVGKLHPLPGSLDPTKIRVAAEVRAKNIHPLSFQPYYGRHIPMRRLEGLLDIQAHYEGDFSGLFRSWGQITVKEGGLDYPQVFDTILKPKTFTAVYDLRLNREHLTISDITFKLPETEIRGRCTIRDIRSARRRIDAFATTGPFGFDNVRHYIPFRIMSIGFGRVMREVTRRGNGRVVSFRMNGPIKDFSMLEDPEKADLVYGKMRLDGLIFPFRKDLHPIEEISGWVTLEEGALRFLDLRGSSRKSRLNATEMRISRIFSSPRLDLEVDGSIDLEGIVQMAKETHLLGAGFPIGGLSGRGDLRLKAAAKLTGLSELDYKGHLDLEGANITMRGFRVPVAEVSGRLMFSKNQLRLIGLKGKIKKSVLWADGRMGNPWEGQSGGEQLSITIGGELDLEEWFPGLLPRLSPGTSEALASFSGISGGARLTLKLTGKGNGLKGIRYNGRVILENAVFRHPRMVSPVRFVKGEVSFSPQVVRLVNTEVRLKESYLRLDGSIRDYLVWKRAKVDLRIRAANLDIGDFLVPERGYGEWMWRGGIALPEFGGVTLRVKEGRWRYTDFSNLIADITLANGKLSLDRFHCVVKGGEADVTAWVDLGREDEVSFALNPKLSRVDAERFIRDFGLQERVWITGSFNLWGSLTGRGRNEEEVRGSLKGKVWVGMEKGKIRRWRVLSKVLSVLNVLQLFKGKLPEITGEGLPYNAITGEIEIANGIARTNDLLVDSDAMKITIVGRADIAREELDITMGLRPLGTVDTIVSRVPMVGRILAGDDKSVVAYYVEVKGNFSNPQVKHIPLKSIERGLIEMIRRTLETPIHLIPRGKEWVRDGPGSHDRIQLPEEKDEDDFP